MILDLPVVVTVILILNPHQAKVNVISCFSMHYILNYLGCQLAAAMDAADGATSTSFGLPGDLSDLLLPGASSIILILTSYYTICSGNGMPSGPGHLPTARPPQKMHKSEKQKPKPIPHPPISKPLESSRQSYSKESHVPASMPTFGSSMPTFGDLGDDLQLSDDSD